MKSIFICYNKTIKGDRMEFNCLIPELRVSDLEKSKMFYTKILGFKIEYEREDFAMVVLGKCQIMLQQLILPRVEGSWNVSEDMKYPFGRGINLQIILPDISIIYNSLKHNNIKLFIDLLLSDYQENDLNNHVLEFLVQDPDGYLLRFQQEVEDWCFADDKETADLLFNLVKKGDKTATSYIYEEHMKLNKGFSILTNWDKTERILLQTTKIYVTPFKKVTRQHAYKEGEDDKTIKSWKNIHNRFFSEQLSKHGLLFQDDTKIVCEEFNVVKNTI